MAYFLSSLRLMLESKDIKLPKIKRGFAGGIYLVFPSSYYSEMWDWLLGCIFRLSITCFGEFENAFCVYDKEEQFFVWCKKEGIDIEKWDAKDLYRFQQEKAKAWCFCKLN